MDTTLLNENTLLNEKIPDYKIRHTLEAMSNYNDLPKKCKLVFINIEKIDNSWKKSNNYIGKFDAIKFYGSKQKLLNSKKDLMELRVTVPPYIYLDINGNINFCNGRNRFANLRNAGVKEMPFVIETRDYKKLIKQSQ